MPTEDAPYDPIIGLEAWKFTGAGKLYVAMLTGKYGEIRYEAIHGHKVFHLSPAERRINSLRCKNAEVDPFKNGTCVALDLPASTPADDREFIENNPESLTDAQIADLFKGGRSAKADTALADKLEEITNPITLARIYSAAKAADLQLSKIGLIQLRIAEVTGITEGGRVIIPVTNELDSPELYGDESGIRARAGIAGASVG